MHMHGSEIVVCLLPLALQRDVVTLDFLLASFNMDVDIVEDGVVTLLDKVLLAKHIMSTPQNIWAGSLVRWPAPQWVVESGPTAAQDSGVPHGIACFLLEWF